MVVHVTGISYDGLFKAITNRFQGGRYMSTCPKCGATNKPTANFCGKCREPLGGQQAAWKQCKNGHNYQGAVCPHCPPGVQGGAPPTKVEEKSRPQQGGKWDIPGGVTKVEESKPRRDVTVVESGPQGAPKRLVGWLVVIRSETEKIYNFFPLYDGRNSIRRANKGTCTVSIKDPAVTGEQHHAFLDLRSGQYFVSDNGSTAGTYVNGEMILTPTEVSDGDQIQVGNTTLSFRSFQVVAETA